MDLLIQVGEALDDRLLANLVAVHVILAAILVVSFVVRKLLLHGSDSLVRWTGLSWLERVGEEAKRRTRALMFWVTLVAVAAAMASATVYHVLGRDVRPDLEAWYRHLAGPQLLVLAWTGAKLGALAALVWLTLGLVRRGIRLAEAYALRALEEEAGRDVPPSEVATPGAALPASALPERVRVEETTHRWFGLLERFCLAAAVLGGLWGAGAVLDWPTADIIVLFLLRLLAIVTAARLATLACSTIFRVLTRLGNRRFAASALRRYWEHVARLFPFGQKCFEAAVWIYASTRAVALFRGVAFVEDYGDNIVKCIGIFFVTRVLIELAHVLIHEAFGLYRTDRPVDQKGQTLVPLLESVSQYVLYFGSVMVMLEICQLPGRNHILAGAGLLGLAVGLGAQSLVTDLVSGFFILFENQFLVGDVVQIGEAQGRVEAVGIRTTHIRDDNGKLFIIPNGQVKNVVNFSKGYINAVVDYKAPISANLEQLVHDMTEAGRRLRAQRREVLAETVIKALVDLTPGDMTVRAVTKVQPGTHQAMQLEYRRLLKQVLDERQAKAKAAA
ncbi:MAG: mechanosensitive ion channel family protein [Gemmataceae bacterium]|nr:mechanosensitive ion channel family protein [Gemmataceae bacterium]